MGTFAPGDVLLAPVSLDGRAPPKVRPVIVIAAGASGTLHVLPVSSRPSSGSESLQLNIDNFKTGGLDLFGESYVITSRVLTITRRQVIGKKGHLNDEAIRNLLLLSE